MVTIDRSIDRSHYSMYNNGLHLANSVMQPANVKVTGHEWHDIITDL